MSQLESRLSTIRHSTAHVLAQAVLKKFPDAKLAIGPAIESGFYYDFDIETPLTEDILIELEDIMKTIINENQEFKQYDLSKKEAIINSEKTNQPYKLELIKDLNLDTYSFYENGPFTDLCKGPHINNTKEIKAFKLLKVSGAYWRGSEKNKMLQRIYGTAFTDKKELRLYMNQLEEAKKRDHRKLGKELKLFSINEEVGSGLILWHPKGTTLRNQIEDYWKKEHIKNQYQLVMTPHVGKSELWKTSGHLDFYQENMYEKMDVESQAYFLKPMNCPFHIMIYKDTQHSYRNLPIRYAELGTVYRYERSGVLHGLLRVRGFTQDDAHIICSEDQVESEILTALEFSLKMLKAFGFKEFKLFLSTKPEEKFVGNDSQWKLAEKSLEKAIKKTNIEFEIDAGGGAFYGPKIDIKIKDAIGRQWQCSTIQFDFNLPERFNMTFINSKGEKARPFMIHRALLGSIERFIGILIEEYAGWLPLWISPIQCQILTINNNVKDYAEKLDKQLTEAGFRTKLNASSDKLNYKIRESIKQKTPYLLIIGDKEKETNTITLRNKNTQLGTLSKEELIKKLSEENEILN
jgi:threonyl-tRNA synthetase